MNNMPEVKIGVVAVSRDCFPESLSVNRRKNLMKAYTEKYEVPVVLVLEVQRNLLHMLHRWLLKQQQRLLLFTD